MTETRRVRVRRRGDDVDDLVAVEEPLEIRLGMSRRGMRGQKSISVTMRTPGGDRELAVGFLHGEQIIRRREDVAEVRHCGDGDKINPNVVRVELHEHVEVDLGRLKRNFYTTSSCGVCGKSSLEALALQGCDPIDSDLCVSETMIRTLPRLLRERQDVFDRTGGLHAAGVFDASGLFVDAREDVGRHNALDKVVGAAFLDGRSLEDSVLVLSGRASFELLQKALVARIPVVAAVGAPSSLAVELAIEFGVTLLGFVREDRCNVYSHPGRIV